MDNDIDPANLGKGDHIYVLAHAINHLGGNVPSVTNVPSLMAFEKSQGMDFIVVKCATGAKEYPSAEHPQFTAELVNEAHEAGLKIFGYCRSDGKELYGELKVVSKAYRMGADGFVLDAEAEWEPHKLTNNFQRAIELCSAIKKKYPKKFLAHAPMPVISKHPNFPYKEFSYYCDAVMPQYYWLEGGVGKIAEYSPSVMVAKMDVEWRNWQNSLTGVWTNAIKPIAPIGQGWDATPSNVVTGIQITEFVKALKNDPNPVTPTGYNGVSYWRADLHKPDVWAAIAAGDIGKPPSILRPPENALVTNLPTNVTFSVEANGAMPRAYQWYFNGKSIPGATGSSYTIDGPTRQQAGSYTVMVMNRLDSVMSKEATLKIVFPAKMSAIPSQP